VFNGHNLMALQLISSTICRFIIHNVIWKNIFRKLVILKLEIRKNRSVVNAPHKTGSRYQSSLRSTHLNLYVNLCTVILVQLPPDIDSGHLLRCSVANSVNTCDHYLIIFAYRISGEGVKMLTWKNSSILTVDQT
jgi:hypothetical protein